MDVRLLRKTRRPHGLSLMVTSILFLYSFNLLNMLGHLGQAWGLPPQDVIPWSSPSQMSGLPESP